jgi:hypothetical protein
MARYTVTHSCGHEQEHQLIGKHSERERKLEWLATRPCIECYRKGEEEARAEENAAAAEANVAAGLSPLTGTPKQIAWAETIRRNTVERLRAGEAKIRELLDANLPAEVAEQIRDGAVLISAEITEHTEARWWIDSRNANGDAVYCGIDTPGKGLGSFAIDSNPYHTAQWFLAHIRARGLAPAAFPVKEADRG